MEQLKKISAELEETVGHGGFRFKETRMSGDPEPEEGRPKILGLVWDTEADRLAVEIKVNFSGKRKGAKISPDEDLEEDVETFVARTKVTKRVIWRVAQAQYDPLGLLAPYLIQMKIVMRNLCAEDGSVKGWDEPVSEPVNNSFKKVLGGQIGRAHV